MRSFIHTSLANSFASTRLITSTTDTVTEKDEDENPHNYIDEGLARVNLKYHTQRYPRDEDGGGPMFPSVMVVVVVVVMMSKLKRLHRKLPYQDGDCWRR